MTEVHAHGLLWPEVHASVKLRAVVLWYVLTDLVFLHNTFSVSVAKRIQAIEMEHVRNDCFLVDFRLNDQSARTAYTFHIFQIHFLVSPFRRLDRAASHRSCGLSCSSPSACPEIQPNGRRPRRNLDPIVGPDAGDCHATSCA